MTLRRSLQNFRRRERQTARSLQEQENVNISYKVNKDAEQEKSALTVDHFGDRERTSSTNASIQYDDAKKEFTITSEVQGDEIDESRLMSFVDQTLDADFTSALL